MFGSKSREIEELNDKIKNRDILIEDQSRTIEALKAVINSLEDDVKSLREASFESSKKETKKTTTKKKTTKKETTSKTTKPKK